MGGHITLTTDFGENGPYPGAMKGVILSINPEARIVDITHGISSGNIMEGAFVLMGASRYYPKGTIHVGVVDPGVGSARRPILIETERHFFIGPDNGLFSLAIEGEEVKRIIHLTNRRYFRPEVSNTFHGRDIFTPVAAHLSLGVSTTEFGDEVFEPLQIGLPETQKEDGSIKGEVIYIDSFGNLITNIRKEDIPESGFFEASVEVAVKGVRIKGVKKTYSSAEKGAPLALISSSDLLEIAVNSGAASRYTGAAVGERVTLKLHSKRGGV